MNLYYKIRFHTLKILRMAWYHLRYRIHPWKRLEGIEIPVQLKYGYSVLRFIDNGQYEQHEIGIIKKTLSKEDTVLELGTGIGFVSAYSAMQVGNNRVYTFEGNAALQPDIDKLYRKNKVQPQSHIAMLGKGSGNKAFFRDENSFLASSANTGDGAGHVKTEVPLHDLNEVIATLQPSYLMMDIEGGEADIFEIIDFQSIQKVQFELHPAVLDREQIKNIFAKLEAYNFVKDPQFNFEKNYFFKRSQPATSL